MNQTIVKEALGSGVVIEAVQSMTGAESIAPDHMGRGSVSAKGYIPKAMTIGRELEQEVHHLLFAQAAMLDRTLFKRRCLLGTCSCRSNRLAA